MKLSIRLKLTLWYSLILIVTSLAYIVISNVVVTQQLHKSPPELESLIVEAQTELFNDYRSTGVEPDSLRVRQVIEEIRERDLARIRLYSVGIFFILMGLSFGGGYVIAGRTLRPLYNSLRAQKQFIANASHELKTPLTIVQTNLEAAWHEVEHHTGSSQEYLRQALDATEFMNQLIEDLLVLALPPDQTELQEVDLATVVKRATERLQPLAERSGKVITQQPSATSTVGTVQGSNALLERAVMNCIENAIRYAQHHITVTLAAAAGQTVITIHDDGLGIPPEAITKVTERFYRVDQGRSRTAGGSGLGLAITKAIMERHHGQIQISSNQDHGTTVTLTL